MRARGSKQEIEDKKQQFGMWLGIPPAFRVPKSQEEFGEKLGINVALLTRWKQDEIVIKAKEAAVKLLAGNDMYEVVQAMTAKAKEGNPQMARLFMEYLEQIGTKKGRSEPIEFVIRHGVKEGN